MRQEVERGGQKTRGTNRYVNALVRLQKNLVLMPMGFIDNKDKEMASRDGRCGLLKASGFVCDLNTSGVGVVDVVTVA